LREWYCPEALDGSALLLLDMFNRLMCVSVMCVSAMLMVRHAKTTAFLY